MKFSEKFLKLVKEGKVLVFYCKPLAEFEENLAYCSKREECKQLNEIISKNAEHFRSVVNTMYCDFCESKDWIIVAVDLEEGILIKMTCKPEYGKKVLSIIKSK